MWGLGFGGWGVGLRVWVSGVVVVWVLAGEFWVWGFGV